MNVRLFVASSSILLAGWLGLTFVRKVPMDSYPSHGPISVRAQANKKAHTDSKIVSAQSEQTSAPEKTLDVQNGPIIASNSLDD